MASILKAGFLVLDKAEGITSHDLVAQARRTLGTRKIGHAGTLDPMATGVMVLGVEGATRLLDYIMAGKKRYLATVKLGMTTDTDDRTGRVISESEVTESSREEAARKLLEMTGVIRQVPSMVSAIKVDGKRAYERVRDGEQVQLKARSVEIFDIQVLAKRFDGSINELDLDISCSAGTYIRAIARDIGGHLRTLRRIEAEPFTLADCSEIADKSLVPAARAIAKVLPTRRVSGDEIAALGFGKSISSISKLDTPIAAVSDEDDVIAILHDDGESARPKAVFIERERVK